MDRVQYLNCQPWLVLLPPDILEEIALLSDFVPILENALCCFQTGTTILWFLPSSSNTDCTQLYLEIILLIDKTDPSTPPGLVFKLDGVSYLVDHLSMGHIHIPNAQQANNSQTNGPRYTLISWPHNMKMRIFCADGLSDAESVQKLSHVAQAMVSNLKPSHHTHSKLRVLRKGLSCESDSSGCTPLLPLTLLSPYLPTPSPPLGQHASISVFKHLPPSTSTPTSTPLTAPECVKMAMQSWLNVAIIADSILSTPIPPEQVPDLVFGGMGGMGGMRGKGGGGGSGEEIQRAAMSHDHPASLYSSLLQAYTSLLPAHTESLGSHYTASIHAHRARINRLLDEMYGVVAEEGSGSTCMIESDSASSPYLHTPHTSTPHTSTPHTSTPHTSILSIPPLPPPISSDPIPVAPISHTRRLEICKLVGVEVEGLGVEVGGMGVLQALPRIESFFVQRCWCEVEGVEGVEVATIK